MVKKLLKYDFQSYTKTILPMEIILLGIAIVTRIIGFFENKSITYNIFSTSSVVLLVIAMVVCIVMTAVVCVVRFYKNLYTAEGYLTLSLPVTHKAHIISKLITSVTASILSLVSVVVALLIATLGETSHEIIKAFIYLVKWFYKCTKVHAPFYTAELIVIFIVSLISSYLLIFACITFGQRAKKNRVLMAFGVYFIYYAIRQTFGTVLMVLYTTLYDKLHIDKIVNWIINHDYTSAHIIALFLILLTAVLGAVYFIVCEKIMRKHLNLE